MLKLDRFEKARATTTTVINRLKNQAKDKQDALAGLEGEDVGKKLAELSKELESMDKENRVLKDKLAVDGKGLQGLAERVSELEGKQEESREIEDRINKLAGEVKTHREKMDSIRYKLKNWLEKDVGPDKRAQDEKIKSINNELEKLGKPTTWEIAEYFGIPEEIAVSRLGQFATERERERWDLLDEI